MTKKICNIKFIKFRLCICCMIWLVGLVLCMSNRNLTTEYRYLSLYVPVEKTEFVQGDVFEQQVVFDKTNLGCIGFAVVDRTKSCSGNLRVLLIDENNQCVWEDIININDIELKTNEWFQLNQSVSAGEPYKLSISSDDLQGKLASCSVFGRFVPRPYPNRTYQRDYVERTISLQ